MTHIVSDGLSLVQATGQKVRGGVGTMATGIRNEAGAVANGIREEIDGVRQRSEPAAHKREQSVWPAHATELAATTAGALAGFFVSRLVRTRLRRPGR